MWIKCNSTYEGQSPGRCFITGGSCCVLAPTETSALCYVCIFCKHIAISQRCRWFALLYKGLIWIAASLTFESHPFFVVLTYEHLLTLGSFPFAPLCTFLGILLAIFQWAGICIFWQMHCPVFCLSSALLITQSTVTIPVSPHRIPPPQLSLHQLKFCICFRAQPKCYLLPAPIDLPL